MRQLIIAGLCLAATCLSSPASARVERIEILSRQAFAAGTEFGHAGSYEKLRGRAFFALDPNAAGSNPLNPRYSLVAFAGLSAEATWQCVQRLPDGSSDEKALTTEVFLMVAGSAPKPVIASLPEEKPSAAAGKKQDAR